MRYVILVSALSVFLARQLAEILSPFPIHQIMAAEQIKETMANREHERLIEQQMVTHSR